LSILEYTHIKKAISQNILNGIAAHREKKVQKAIK